MSIPGRVVETAANVAAEKVVNHYLSTGEVFGTIDPDAVRVSVAKNVRAASRPWTADIPKMIVLGAAGFGLGYFLPDFLSKRNP